jgi:hypothetical protein
MLVRIAITKPNRPMIYMRFFAQNNLLNTLAKFVGFTAERFVYTDLLRRRLTHSAVGARGRFALCAGLWRVRRAGSLEREVGQPVVGRPYKRRRGS